MTYSFRTTSEIGVHCDELSNDDIFIKSNPRIRDYDASTKEGTRQPKTGVNDSMKMSINFLDKLIKGQLQELLDDQSDKNKNTESERKPEEPEIP
uniref:Uncharacterized protein n=1 Tax=Setaria digitata TaxID=48799 RepID=A0A915PCV4_9BILA